MKICRRLPELHFELLFPFLFSFVETSTGSVDRMISPHAFMDVLRHRILEIGRPQSLIRQKRYRYALGQVLLHSWNPLS